MGLRVFGSSILLLVLGACIRPEPVPYRVFIGMSEAKLKAAVGEPTTVESSLEGDTYRYQIWLYNGRGRATALQHWHVHMKEGRVDAYGWDQAERQVKPTSL
jgi:hypothetical protein